MILQALKEYYDRKAVEQDAQTASEGFEWKDIPYVLVLDSDGKPVSLNCTYEGTGKQRRAKKYLVPQAVKRSSGIAANLLWDNPEYVFGLDLKGKPDRVIKQHKDFCGKIELLGEISDAGVIAVKRFLAREDKIALLERFSETWKNLCDEGANISFQLAGEQSLVVESDEVKDAVKKMGDEKEGRVVTCLITGKPDTLMNLHTSIKGIWGAQTSGANIVAFNQGAFRSFGKKQGENAPVGKNAAFAYTTALNTLLDKDSRQRMQVGDASTVFWSSKETYFEENFRSLFSEPPKDDPDRNTRAVQSLFNAVHSGALPPAEADTKFYVLGLAPNASRIAVRF